MAKNLKYYFQKAQKEKFAIPQFNFSDFTQVKGIVSAAARMKSPVILGTSEGESKFFGLEEAVAVRNVVRKKTGLPIFLNLDHGKSLEYIKLAVLAGYDMVHFDGSRLELKDNIKISKEVVKYARKKGVLIEGEVGKIGTESSKVYVEKFQVNEEDLTKPIEAKEFLKKTNVDLLAVSIGNFHGIEVSGICPDIRTDLLLKIKEIAGEKTPIVLHGGSGTMDEDIQKTIKNGVVKININTEIRLAFSGNLRRALVGDPDGIVPYKFLLPAMLSVEKVAEKKIELFSSHGKA